MREVNGLDCYQVSFGDHGQLDQGADGDDDLPATIRSSRIADLFVFAAGWNAGSASTRVTEDGLLSLLAGQLGVRRDRCAALAVRWPSLLFPEDDPSTSVPTPSTGAQLASALAPAFPHRPYQLDELGALLDQQPATMAELERFHRLAAALVTTPSLALEDSGGAAVLSAGTASLLGLAAAITDPVPGLSADGSDSYSLLWAGAREVLRMLAYYELKNRAGVIGRDGLGPLLGQLGADPAGPRIHLIGHSFGARLVAYALAGLPAGGAAGRRSPVKSLYLIQGALSHFCFANGQPVGPGSRSGALGPYAGQVDGPLLATFSRHDRLLGWWYPIIGLLDRTPGLSATETLYRWGAVGHDGFQDERARRLPLGSTDERYSFVNGAEYVLDASAVVSANQSSLSGAHSDILHPEVTWPVVCAAQLG